MLESDAADRGGAREMRGVETPQPQRRHLLPLARPAEVSPAAVQFGEKRDRSTPSLGWKEKNKMLMQKCSLRL